MNAPAKVIQIPDRVDLPSFVKMTEGDGIVLWSLVTDHPLKSILAPGYFDKVAAAIRRFDRVELTCEAGGDPQHVRLIVLHTDKAQMNSTKGAVEVEVLKGA